MNAAPTGYTSVGWEEDWSEKEIDDAIVICLKLRSLSLIRALSAQDNKDGVIVRR